MTLRVERLGADEWPRWREVRIRALRTDPDAFACSAHRLGADTPPEQWREAMADRSVFLAVDEDGDVAMVGVTHTATPELVSMWVAPQARGTGVGLALVQEVLAVAGARPVALRVMAGNETAMRFYERCGFVLVTDEPDVEGTLTMRRDATPAPAAWPAPAARPHRPGGSPPAPTADQ